MEWCSVLHWVTSWMTVLSLIALATDIWVAKDTRTSWMFLCPIVFVQRAENRECHLVHRLWAVKAEISNGWVFSPAGGDGTYCYAWNPLVSTVRVASQREGSASVPTIENWTDWESHHHGVVLRKSEEDYQEENR